MRKVLVLAVLLLATACLADTFRIEGRIISPYTGPVGTFGGWIGINTGTGVITNWLVLMPYIPAGRGEPAASGFTFSPSDSTFVLSGGDYELLSFTQFHGLLLRIPNNTLIGFSGSVFSGDYGQPRGPNGFNYYVDGSITPATAPEPSSLLLMGSGLAGILAWRHKAVFAGHSSTRRKAFF